MLQKHYKFFPIFLGLIALCFVVILPVLAADALPQVPQSFESTIILPKTDIVLVVARIINVALSFLGVVAVILIIYGGFVWMTSGGNEEKIATAKKVLKDAGIGLFIILASFAIAQFIFSRLGVNGENVPLAAPSPLAFRIGGGALGGGIIESHYPMRGQIGVARNTKIVITFKDAVDPASLADTTFTDPITNRPQYYTEVSGNRTAVTGLTLKTNAIQIIKTINATPSTREASTGDYFGSVGVSFTSDLRTFVFAIPVLEGKVSYNVYLCGAQSRKGNCGPGIQLLSGAPAFISGLFPDYEWFFETSTDLDLTPPTIKSVIPLPDNSLDSAISVVGLKDPPKNTLIQINFSEEILPTVASGTTAVNATGGIVAGTFNALRVAKADGKNLPGSWQIGNVYRTTEFTSTDKCAQNTCGDDVFCLPGNENINLETYAASLKTPADNTSFVSAGLLDGVEDLAGNSLNGKDDDSLALGPSDFYDRNDKTGQGDNVKWSFWTSDVIDILPPKITSNNPVFEAPGVDLGEPVKMNFSKLMSLTSLNNKNLFLTGQENATAKPWQNWWTAEGDNNLSGTVPVNSTAKITHGGFGELSAYQTFVNQGAKDLYQNCFFPSNGTACANVNADKPYCCNGEASATKCF